MKKANYRKTLLFLLDKFAAVGGTMMVLCFLGAFLNEVSIISIGHGVVGILSGVIIMTGCAISHTELESRQEMEQGENPND